MSHRLHFAAAKVAPGSDRPPGAHYDVAMGALSGDHDAGAVDRDVIDTMAGNGPRMHARPAGAR